MYCNIYLAMAGNSIHDAAMDDKKNFQTWTGPSSYGLL